MNTEEVAQALNLAAECLAAGDVVAADRLGRDVLESTPNCIGALHLTAVVAFRCSRFGEGREWLERVFALDPGYAPAYETLGDALAVRGECGAAIEAFQLAVRLRPEDGNLAIKFGLALCQGRRFGEAEAAYRRAVVLEPRLTRVRFNLAVLCASQGRRSEAEGLYRQLAVECPDDARVWLNLGNVLADLGKLDEAIVSYRAGLVVAPLDAGLQRNLGAALYRCGLLDEAIVAYSQARSLDADQASLRVLSMILHEAGRFEEALRAYQSVVTRDPADVAILSNMGACLHELGRYDEAISACERALQRNSSYAPALTNLGIVYESRDEVDAAVEAHSNAVRADPSYARGYTNLAVALRNAGDIDAALAAARRSVELDPDQPLAHYNYAHLLLMNGDLPEGFAEYQWRRRCTSLMDGDPSFPGPEWDGGNFAGRTLLLFAEYGLGDAIQFVRYLPWVVRRGGSVVLQVQPALVRLFREIAGVTVIARGEKVPAFDLQLPLMSLPRVFGTTLESIPASIPYLRPATETRAAWRHALDVEALRVGVVWAGNPRHKGDRQRSLSAEDVLPQLVLPGVQLFSLQKEPRPADCDCLGRLGSRVVDLAPWLGDLSDTAAVIAMLDLVIAVDTSVAHLAGALGRPVWVLLPYALDWRWLREREDTPWYPTMRLFRQKRPRAWGDVLRRVSEELGALAKRQPEAHEPVRSFR